MIRTKDELKRYIEYETRNFDHPILLKIPVDLYESQIIARYLILLRKTEYHINCGHKIRKIFYLLRLKRKQCRYGIHIPVNVFDKGLSIAHLGTIVVNGNAKIGKDCRIHVGVVIGANGENVRAPASARLFPSGCRQRGCTSWTWKSLSCSGFLHDSLPAGTFGLFREPVCLSGL